jgi:hypothetical protein
MGEREEREKRAGALKPGVSQMRLLSRLGRL